MATTLVLIRSPYETFLGEYHYNWCLILKNRGLRQFRGPLKDPYCQMGNFSCSDRPYQFKLGTYGEATEACSSSSISTPKEFETSMESKINIMWTGFKRINVTHFYDGETYHASEKDPRTKIVFNHRGKLMNVNKFYSALCVCVSGTITTKLCKVLFVLFYFIK